MVTALQIFCLIVAGISYIGVVAEQEDKIQRITLLGAAIGFTAMAIWLEINIK